MKEYHTEYEKYLITECFPSYAFRTLFELAKDRVRLHFPAYGEYGRFLYFWEIHKYCKELSQRSSYDQ